MSLNLSLEFLWLPWSHLKFNPNQQMRKLYRGLGSNHDCLKMLIKKEGRRKMKSVTKLFCDWEFTFQNRLIWFSERQLVLILEKSLDSIKHWTAMWPLLSTLPKWGAMPVQKQLHRGRSIGPSHCAHAWTCVCYTWLCAGQHQCLSALSHGWCL